MPSKYVVKDYVVGGYYHLLNRGIEGRLIFQDHRDYVVFTDILKNLLTSPDDLPPGYIQVRPVRISDVYDKVSLICYCLMPNHYHIVLKQLVDGGVTHFMRRLTNAYVKYFNARNDRVGGLFEGKMKAVSIDRDEYLLHLSRYIHVNPYKIVDDLGSYQYSSYNDYLNTEKRRDWINAKEVLDFFSENEESFNSYNAFVDDYKEEKKRFLGELLMEY